MIETIRTAVEHFWDFLSEIELVPLLAAIGCQVLKLACVSRAWRNVLAAAYPDRTVPWSGIGAAYVAGVGVNAILPARGGDVVRVYMAHRAIKGSSYTTVIASTVVLTFVDLVLSVIVFLWALTQGLLPSIDVLSRLPSFDYSWAFQDGVIHPGVVIAIVAVGALVVWLLDRYWNRLRARVGQAFAVFDPPQRYVRTVVLWQLGDWSLRLATIWFFLGAFGIHQSVTNVLLVQAAMSLSTLVPATPGGIGTEQALLVYAFRNAGIAETTLLAFSVGMKITLTVVNVVLGFTAIFLTLGTIRFRSVVQPPPDAKPPPT
ncbi:MAG TPA: lysylphosphatidylglycerol synthase transmembrane domain-containing protein [Gaiella sp.]|nr:lysylphosphatidylglycerol synthase transmembrane domain-containing protein [Gaiella sp.]